MTHSCQNESTCQYFQTPLFIVSLSNLRTVNNAIWLHISWGQASTKSRFNADSAALKKTKKLTSISIKNLILFYLLSVGLNRLTLCENAGHGNAISFIINADLIASSTAFDSLGLQGFGWIVCAFIVELDAIVFKSGSDQVFLKFLLVFVPGLRDWKLGLVLTLSRMVFSISPI